MTLDTYTYTLSRFFHHLAEAELSWNFTVCSATQLDTHLLLRCCLLTKNKFMHRIETEIDRNGKTIHAMDLNKLNDIWRRIIIIIDELLSCVCVCVYNILPHEWCGDFELHWFKSNWMSFFVVANSSFLQTRILVVWEDPFHGIKNHLRFSYIRKIKWHSSSRVFTTGNVYER